ncbi:MAG: biotin/lipoyl-binding protein [Firmicutes bacterium]|nr:biotin/lipoyl-binding protein [Bacillota bacterium]
MPRVRRFRVTVNGKVYEVEAEELTGAVTVPDHRPEPLSSTPTASEVPPAPSRAAGTGTTIEAPLPGLVLEVKVAEGQAVASGQVLIILEAMKMENEITAPEAGVVQSVRVAKGDSVAQGDILVVLA